MVAFLVSDRVIWITGRTFTSDGRRPVPGRPPHRSVRGARTLSSGCRNARLAGQARGPLVGPGTGINAPSGSCRPTRRPAPRAAARRAGPGRPSPRWPPARPPTTSGGARRSAAPAR
ncbi:hypothetical protein [Saccharothrix coeruleofusca]|uniref:hypothetical protein n=1 Tax=Saccharothrix coeruleofusca TaxID=33919 RepID=UPI00278C3650|nr:hypothetical protein [Saccharothrix coeruleofusca]